MRVLLGSEPFDDLGLIGVGIMKPLVFKPSFVYLGPRPPELFLCPVSSGNSHLGSNILRQP